MYLYSYIRFVALFVVALSTASAFTVPRGATNNHPTTQSQTVVLPTPATPSTSSLFIFKKDDDEEDLSYLEVRDMTRDEMAQLNAENERVMNAELWGMTIFSLIISIPMLYLVWVGFFSETAEMNLDM